MNYTTKNDKTADADSKAAEAERSDVGQADAGNGSDLIVQAGYVTVRKQVGAGMAYVDVPQGEVIGDDVSQEDRDRLLASKAIGRRDGGEAYVTAGRPVAGEVEPDEIDTDVIPGGTIEQIMAWVGDDLARARVARDMEESKGKNARATLLAKLDEVKKSTETEPPEVPEFFTGDVAPAPAGGGVATPVDDSDVAGKPADEVPASKSTRNR